MKSMAPLLAAGVWLACACTDPALTPVIGFDALPRVDVVAPPDSPGPEPDVAPADVAASEIRPSDVPLPRDVPPADLAPPDVPPGDDAPPVSDVPLADDVPTVPDGGPSPDTLYVSSGSPFLPGPLAVHTLDVAARDHGAPVDLQVHLPEAEGRYAVVVFQHGFLMANRYYGDVLRHLASHGFVVVAPQMYAPGGLPFGKPTSAEEAATAADLRAWLRAGLAAATEVWADTDALGYAGHSRGAKVAWLLLDGDPTGIRAVAGVDPVDGTGGPLGGDTRVCDGPFDFPFPSLVLGTGFGPEAASFLEPACAPAGDNHEQFWQYSAAPAWHVIATDYGHLDMLDDAPEGCGLECTVCLAGDDKAAMRRLTAGLLVALFRGALQGDESAYAYLEDPWGAPVPVTMEVRR